MPGKAAQSRPQASTSLNSNGLMVHPSGPARSSRALACRSELMHAAHDAVVPILPGPAKKNIGPPLDVERGMRRGQRTVGVTDAEDIGDGLAALV